MMRKALFTVALAACLTSAHATAWADSFNVRPAVPGISPTGVPPLQNVFSDIGSTLNANTDQNGAALFQPMSIGGTLNSLFFENPGAAFRNFNRFGIYSAADPTKMLQIFAGPDSPVTRHAVEFESGPGFDGVELDNNPATLISGFGNAFGFYLVNGLGATFYSEDSRNPGGFAEALIYRGNGDRVDLFEANDGIPGCQGVPGACLSDANSWYVAFEDLSVPGPNGGFGPSDRNYSDMVVQVDDIEPVPEPGSMALFGTGLLWIAGAARRRLKR